MLVGVTGIVVAVGDGCGVGVAVGIVVGVGLGVKVGVGAIVAVGTLVGIDVGVGELHADNAITQKIASASFNGKFMLAPN